MAPPSSGQIDSFIDDEDLTCPLCVEEFDLSDRNFVPCPCQYKICQFCFNNIKQNMNGLCPACRRPYDEKTIQWKVVTPEEVAEFKAAVQKNAKKKAEIRQKEAQKREAESASRKHLAGLRVVQKNLVYVVGLAPTIRDDELHQTLRGQEYFGQYGEIAKIMISKGGKDQARGSAQSPQSLGIYVTFVHAEDADKCIKAVNGSQNGDRVLKAQLGTTKYCSSFLRNEVCPNKQCMFLHEAGDNDNSYSRQDLSSINSVASQRPLPAGSSAAAQQSIRQSHQPPAQQAPVAAASQPMAREPSKDEPSNGDGSALPSSASWANHPTQQQRSRRGSHATSGAASSPRPADSASAPAATEASTGQAPAGQELAEEPPQADPTPEPTPAEAPPEKGPTSILKELVASATDPAFGFVPRFNIPDDEMRLIKSMAPLWDEHGGEKRRALREQQEEAGLHVEQESQNDLRSVAEPVEEEEPESGSLQLGGEPERPEDVREGMVHGQAQSYYSDQRRPSTQMPIQRSANDTPFSATMGRNFPQNLSNLNRALTPSQQQLLLSKYQQPQSALLDHYPPGMGGHLPASAQTGLFQQQQGHNRQSSRYSFANDSASAATVKPAANPMLMAQQAAMMPQNQFYGGTSMPGPPPGLTSTGTPPAGMFGKAHGFGGSVAGGSSAFGGVKESSSDMLREILRGSGSGGGSVQGLGAGKREFMFPNFLHQYPSTSTPAPASGLLASLYGPQPGAFQDFGSKQKKKGKKHRHANTSSSGGGGLVDLADPSILQARLQQQQQSNAGVGQGLFSGQAQDELPSLDEASSSVDALVADDPSDLAVPGPLPTDLFFEAPASRSTTPSVPPGFGFPHAHPPPALREEPKLPSRIVPTSAPFTPTRQSSAVHVPRAATPLSTVTVPPTPQDGVVKVNKTSSATQAKQDVKSSAVSTGLSNTIASHAPGAATKMSSAQNEEFPKLEKGKAPEVMPVTPLKPSTTVPKKSANAPQGQSKAAATPKVAEKKPTPAVLNIAAATASHKPVPTPDTPKPPTTTPALASAFPPLPASTPVALQSPAIRTGPKAIRVVPTPKSEAPTPSSATSAVMPSLPTSRQPSIASARLERTSTPVSEGISDTASINSASMSRASSPPPTRIGSAPVRATTKSQQKKLRREAQREKEKTEKETILEAPEEVEVAPIIGRKKKQKKEKPPKSSASAPPSKPASPAPVEPVKEEKSVAEPPPPDKMSAKQEKNADESSKPVEGKAKGKEDEKEPASASTTEATPDVPPAEKPIPAPASIFHGLIDSGELPDPGLLQFFKHPIGGNHRAEHLSDVQEDTKLSITEEDRITLQSGKPVHKILRGGQRLMLTPNGDCVRNLTAEEEQSYLALQASIAADEGPAAFSSSRYNLTEGFTLIGGRAVPNGPPSYFSHSSTSGADPVNKIQRDEALSYINQFVLPSLSTNSQLEKALNANASSNGLDMFRSRDATNWNTWGADTVGHADDRLDTAFESMTAHFSVGRDTARGQPLGNVQLLSLEGSETLLASARKETDKLEKTLNQLVKKNRRLMQVAGH